MSNTKKTKIQTANSNGGKSNDAAPTNQKESKAYKSAMKAFAMTNKRLHPELYKEKAKRG